MAGFLSLWYSKFGFSLFSSLDSRMQGVFSLLTAHIRISLVRRLLRELSNPNHSRFEPFFPTINVSIPLSTTSSSPFASCSLMV